MTPGPTPTTLGALVTRAAERQGDRLAVEMDGRTLTWAELESAANRVARSLARHGVKPGDRVALWLPKSPEAIATLYGVMKAGAAFVPVDPGAPPARMAWIVRNAGAAALVTAGARLADVAAQLGTADAPAGVWLGDDAVVEGAPSRLTRWSDLATESDAPPATAPKAGDLAYVLYTSGSTGEPKGVMHSHASALAFVRWAAEEFGVTADDRLANHAPFHFDLSTFDLYAAAWAGASVHPVSARIFSFPAAIARDWAARRLSVWYVTPSQLVLMLTRGGLAQHDLSALRVLLFAGEVMPVRQLREAMRLAPHARFANLYGPTETNVCTWHPVDAPPATDAPLPIGRACAGDETLVLGEDERPVARGEAGELWVRGATVMMGYWGDPERTARTLKPVAGEATKGAAYRTGDVVRERDDGALEFLGRRDHQIKTRGYRVELGEIEAALAAHPSVAECVVIAIPDEEITHRLTAAVVASPGATTDAEPLKRHLAATLPRYMVPETVTFHARFPRTSSGKVDRRALAIHGTQFALDKAAPVTRPIDYNANQLDPETASDLQISRVNDMTNVPRRFDLQVLKNKSTTDSAQIPAVGATVSGFESGATAAQATLLQSINTDPPPPQIQFVRVYSPESIRPGDTIRVGPGGPELPVAQVVTVGPNSFDIGLDYTLTTNTNVPLGTRLYNIARPLPASSDPAGLLPLAWPSLTDGLGRAGFYARALKFDYLVQSSDFSPRGYVDFNGSAPREVNWVCATDYASLQDAVGALTAAGVVYIPPGTYTPTSVPAFVPPLEVNLTGTRIIGAGPRSTRLRYFWTKPNWDNNRDLIRLNGDHQSVEDLELQHGAILPPAGGQYGTGAGIRVRAAVDQLSYATAVRNVWIESTPSYGLVFESRPGSTTWAVYGTIEDLVVYKCQNPNHGGIFVGPAQTTTIFFKNCVVREASGAAVRIDGAQGMSFLDCTFDTCITGMRLNGSSNVQIRGCWFEYLQVAPWIELIGQCDGITVADSTFRQLLQGNPEIVRVGSGSRAVTLSGLHISQPSLGTTPHVVVGANSVVSILPCVVRSGGTAHDLLVQDASSKSVLLGAMSRIRIPVITSAEKLALQEVKSGDLIVLDTGTAKIAQIYDGSTWRDLW